MRPALQVAQPGEASPLLVLGSRSAGGYLSRAVGASLSSSRLARRNANSRRPCKASGVANLAGHLLATAMVPAISPFQPCKAFRVVAAGGAKRSGLASRFDQKFDVRPASPHVTAPVLVSPQ